MVGLQSGNSPLKFGKGGGGSKKELPTDNSVVFHSVCLE